MRFTRVHIFNKVFIAQLCHLPSNVGFPYTSNGLTWTVVHSYSSKLLFLRVSKISQETPALESFSIMLQALRPAAFLKRYSTTGVSCKISQIFNNLFFTIQLRWLLLKTFVNCNTKFFDRSSVLRGGRDHTWKDLVSQHLKN